MRLRIVEVFIRIEKLRVQQLFSAYLIKRTAIEYAVLQEKILIHGFFAKDTKYNLPSSHTTVKALILENFAVLPSSFHTTTL